MKTDKLVSSKPFTTFVKRRRINIFTQTVKMRLKRLVKCLQGWFETSSNCITSSSVKISIVLLMAVQSVTHLFRTASFGLFSSHELDPLSMFCYLSFFGCRALTYYVTFTRPQLCDTCCQWRLTS